MIRLLKTLSPCGSSVTAQSCNTYPLCQYYVYRKTWHGGGFLNIQAAALIESLLLVVALSSDAFIASFSYGSNKIKIPLSSGMFVSFICSVVLVVSLLLGQLVSPFIPPVFSKAICFTILLILGLSRFFDASVKALIKKNNNLKKQIKFDMFSLSFILDIYANPENADCDRSNILSLSEAGALAVALSLDGLVIGFGAGLTSANIIYVYFLSLAASFAAITFGSLTGKTLVNKLHFDISWLGGLLLIILAFFKL